MHLQLRTGRDGKLRSRWYGVAMLDGRKRAFPLCRWAGTPPESCRGHDKGDEAFEKSRVRAQAELRAATEGARTEADARALHERALANRYRVKLGAGVPLEGLADRWVNLKRDQPLSPRWEKQCRAMLGGFARHVATAAPKVRMMDAVPQAVVDSWLDAATAGGLSAKTYNDRLFMLRGVFTKLVPYAQAAVYLRAVPARKGETVYRTPYTPAELRAIILAARDDDLMRGPIACAICTGMRRADAAGLRWRSVDLKGGFIIVKTGKTGALAEIPIFPPLRVELERAREGVKPMPNAAVWPDAAAMLKHNPTGLDWRLKKILCAAMTPPAAPKAKTLPAMSQGELRKCAHDALERCGFTPAKAERAARILDTYLTGQSMKRTAAALGVPLSLVSTALNDVQRAAGDAVPVVRRTERRAVDRSITLASDTPEGVKRARRASTGGWHSFRTSWATLALQAGVPPELVARCTAHTTTRTLTRHYFQPRRDALRDALDDAGMAKLLG